jgi:hypothetical protein
MFTPVPGPLTSPRWKEESYGMFLPENVAEFAQEAIDKRQIIMRIFLFMAFTMFYL